MAYTTIDDPSKYFQTALYTSNNTNRTITNDGNSDLQPDFLWGKSRSFAEDHNLVNTSVGVTKHLVSNSSAAEVTDTDRVTGVTSNGFSIGTDHRWNRESNSNMAVWQWKANGGTTASNDASATGIGNTDSVIQANTEAGFSIVTFSGTGSGMTVAHGLGGTPNLIISKARNDTENWAVHTTIIDGSVDYLRLSETDAKGDSSFSAPTSTVFGYNGSNNYVVYCFRSIKGYSKIGTYTGNGSTNGTFTYTGFKPAWIISKRTDASADWHMYDNKREPDNPLSLTIFPNGSSGEVSGDALDFLSNGFKQRNTGAEQNADGGTYVYMAFAENPFVSSKGVPTTAR